MAGRLTMEKESVDLRVQLLFWSFKEKFMNPTLKLSVSMEKESMENSPWEKSPWIYRKTPCIWHFKEKFMNPSGVTVNEDLLNLMAWKIPR